MLQRHQQDWNGPPPERPLPRLRQTGSSYFLEIQRLEVDEPFACPFEPPSDTPRSPSSPTRSSALFRAQIGVPRFISGIGQWRRQAASEVARAWLGPLSSLKLLPPTYASRRHRRRLVRHA